VTRGTQARIHLTTVGRRVVTVSSPNVSRGRIMLKILVLISFSILVMTASVAQVEVANPLKSSTLTLDELSSNLRKFRIKSDTASFVARCQTIQTSSLAKGKSSNYLEDTTSSFYIANEAENYFVQHFCDASWLPVKRESVLLKGNQGQSLTLYSNNNYEYSTGKVGDREEFQRNVFVKSMMNADPRYYAYYGGNYPFDKIIDRKTTSVLDSWPQVKILGEQTVFDSSCVLMEEPQPDNTGSYVIAFDKLHNYIIRQIITYRQSDKDRMVESVLTVPKVVQKGENWFPERVEEHMTFDAAQLGIGIDQAGKKSVEIDRITTFTTLPITDEDRTYFENIRWPEGCSVVDFINSKQFNIVRQAIASPDSVPLSKLPRVEDDPNAHIGNARPAYTVSQSVPSVSFIDSGGHHIDLAQFKGKKNVVLTFFPKCFTGGCTNHLTSLQSVKSELDAAQTQIIAVSVDPADGDKGQKAFAKAWGLEFPLVPDTDRHISKLFGAVQRDYELAARMTYLIDKQGVVRYVDTNVNVGTHGPDIVAKMRELGLITEAK